MINNINRVSTCKKNMIQANNMKQKRRNSKFLANLK